MIREYLSNAGAQGLYIFALVLFLVLFMGMCVKVFGKRSKNKYHAMALLPFYEEDQSCKMNRIN